MYGIIRNQSGSLLNKSLQCAAFAATHTGCPRTSHPGATSELMGHCLSLISEPLRHDGLHASPTSPAFQRQGHQLLAPCCSMVHLAHAHPVSRACDESQTSVSDHWMPKANKAKGKGTSWIFVQKKSESSSLPNLFRVLTVESFFLVLGVLLSIWALEC